MKAGFSPRTSLRTKLAVAALAVAAMAGLGAPVQADEKYPGGVIALITHSSPGGGSDVFLREMIPYLTPYIGGTVIVQNIQGGSGAKAVATTAAAPADGLMFYATTPTYIDRKSVV